MDVCLIFFFKLRNCSLGAPNWRNALQRDQWYGDSIWSSNEQAKPSYSNNLSGGLETTHGRYQISLTKTSSDIQLHTIPDCWRFDSHDRPSFQTIKSRLDDVLSHSNLANIPDESFHLMQDDWRLEISDRMQEIRVKENVSNPFWAYSSYQPDNYYVRIQRLRTNL